MTIELHNQSILEIVEEANHKYASVLTPREYVLMGHRFRLEVELLPPKSESPKGVSDWAEDLDTPTIRGRIYAETKDLKTDIEVLGLQLDRHWGLMHTESGINFRSISYEVTESASRSICDMWAKLEAELDKVRKFEEALERRLEKRLRAVSERLA